MVSYFDSRLLFFFYRYIVRYVNNQLFLFFSRYSFRGGVHCLPLIFSRYLIRGIAHRLLLFASNDMVRDFASPFLWFLSCSLVCCAVHRLLLCTTRYMLFVSLSVSTGKFSQISLQRGRSTKRRTFIVSDRADSYFVSSPWNGTVRFCWGRCSKKHGFGD